MSTSCNTRSHQKRLLITGFNDTRTYRKYGSFGKLEHTSPIVLIPIWYSRHNVCVPVRPRLLHSRGTCHTTTASWCMSHHDTSTPTPHTPPPALDISSHRPLPRSLGHRHTSWNGVDRYLILWEYWNRTRVDRYLIQILWEYWNRTGVDIYLILREYWNRTGVDRYLILREYWNRTGVDRYLIMRE